MVHNAAATAENGCKSLFIHSQLVYGNKKVQNRKIN